MFNDPRIQLLLRQFRGGGLGMQPPQGPAQMSGPIAQLQPIQAAPRQIPSAQPPAPLQPAPAPQPSMGGGMGLMAAMMAGQGRGGAGDPAKEITPLSVQRGGEIAGLLGNMAPTEDMVAQSFWQRLFSPWKS